MKVELPVLVQEFKVDGSPIFHVGPLFWIVASRTGERLDRVLNRLGKDVREHLQQFTRQLNHNALADVIMNPPLETSSLKAHIQLRRQSIKGRWLIVSFVVNEAKIGLITEFPDQWFVIPAGQSVLDRAKEVLESIARIAEKEEMPLPAGVKGREWIAHINANLSVLQQIRQKKIDFAELFGGGDVGSGADELQRVGRNLDALYPEGLNLAYLRETEIDELKRVLDRDDRPSVILAGPSGVGKTTLIHEYVFRRIEPRNGPSEKHNTWLVSPQRLISGMSYVGQWEQRLLGILKYMKKQDHILLIDDVIGLFSAGQTSQSELSVAHVLKPFVERRDIRVVGEMTSESLRVLREIDRGFADMFHLIHVREPEPTQTRQMLVAEMRKSENHRRCRFNLEVLPTVMDLSKRYIHQRSFPGKASDFISVLATRHKDKDVTRTQVIDAFHERSGLPRSYVDDEVKLNRESVIKQVSQRVIGQNAALAAMADVVCIGKARLSDPRRPLGSLLFLGPTGVGKTQCAKSLAGYLYGSDDRLLRFDMNSFNDAGAVSRLVGTFRNPDGQLTAAIRRQPFAVVLLDEIEKADPDVHDLLLQILGEGRLTDALGRTADFTNSIIILTSNLGVYQASHRLGFRPTSDAPLAQDDVFVDAARSFFRPELFNRFDRIVPFQSLNRDEAARVAEILIRDILQREGLKRRRSLLRVDPAATAFVIEHGYDEQFGARAMRRALEQQLTRPIARRLAAMPSDASVVIDIYRGSENLEVMTTALQPTSRTAWPPNSVHALSNEALIARVESTLARLDETVIASSKPVAFSTGEVDAEQLGYLTLREEIADTRRKAKALQGHGSNPKMTNRFLSAPRSRPSASPQRRLDSPKPKFHWRAAPPDIWNELLAADEPTFYLKALVQQNEPTADTDGFQGELIDLFAQLAWLETVAASVERQNQNPATSEEACALLFRSLAPKGTDAINAVGRLLAAAFNLPWGLEATWHDVGTKESPSEFGTLLLSGPGSHALAHAEVGTHMFVDASGDLVPIQTIFTPHHNADEAHHFVQLAEDQWRQALQTNQTTMEAQPFPVAQVHRIIDPRRTTIDLRTGLMTPASPEPYDLIAFALAQVQLPAELLDESVDESTDPES